MGFAGRELTDDRASSSLPVPLPPVMILESGCAEPEIDYEPKQCQPILYKAAGNSWQVI
jgi:hypothetical protein